MTKLNIKQNANNKLKYVNYIKPYLWDLRRHQFIPLKIGKQREGGISIYSPFLVQMILLQGKRLMKELLMEE